MTAATERNKQVMKEVLSAMAEGNGRLLLDAMADDFSWTISGKTAWSRTYRGKQAVINELLRPLGRLLAGPMTQTAQRVIAEGDFVVVECRGHATTKEGQPYDNSYCWVCRLEDGKLKELTEYMDTDLAVRVLGTS
jgi:ketosteroid isomerase-like protein